MSEKYKVLLYRSLVIDKKPYKSNISTVRSWYATVDGILLPLFIKKETFTKADYHLYDSLTKTVLE